jgi:hypothetical protein
MGIYATDGSINVTVVDGTAFTGLYADDGSWNVILAPGDTFSGAQAACGALYVTVGTGETEEIKAPDGSLYVQETPYTGNGQRVTVVSGTLTPTP